MLRDTGMTRSLASLNAADRVAIGAADHWCPGGAPHALFGTRHEAETLSGLREPQNNAAQGEGINVVVVDQGFEKADFPHNFENRIGSAASFESDHAVKVARNILSVAPKVRLYDCPAIPERITDAAALSAIKASYEQILELVPQKEGRWVVVNAWAVYDRELEGPADDYANNPNHPLYRIVSAAVDLGVDVIFAAGNCGQFCPDPRCGTTDSGPGRSIFGVAAHPRALTVGAVRTDGLRLGYSSEGPGPTNLCREKPDLCAPSQFSEVNSASTANRGTSTACALAAGVVAALRSHDRFRNLTPERLKQHLIATTTKPDGASGWNGELGHGILDADAAFRATP